MKPAKTYFKFFMDSLYPSYMNKVFTCFLFFLSFWAVSQKNSVEIKYEDNDSNQRIAEIIESQRNWIKEDLIKLQSSS